MDSFSDFLIISEAIEPLNRMLPPKPGQLTLRIPARVPLHQHYCLVMGNFSIKIAQNIAVAYRVKGF